jgi:hypothetical protein
MLSCIAHEDTETVSEVGAVAAGATGESDYGGVVGGK